MVDSPAFEDEDGSRRVVTDGVSERELPVDRGGVRESPVGSDGEATDVPTGS